MNTKFKLILLIILVAMVSIICIATNSYAAEEESQLEWTDFSNAEFSLEREGTRGATLKISNVKENPDSEYYVMISENKPVFDPEDPDTNFRYLAIYDNKGEEYVADEVQLNQKLNLWIVEMQYNQGNYSYKYVVDGKELTRPEYPKYANVFFATFFADDGTQLKFNVPWGDNTRKINLRIGKITDNSILNKIKNNDITGFEELLEYGKTQTAIYDNQLTSTKYENGSCDNGYDSSDLESIPIIDLKLENEAYYYVYAELDDENGKYYPVEGVTLGQAKVGDDYWSLSVLGDEDFTWSEFGEGNGQTNNVNTPIANNITNANNTNKLPSRLPKAGITVTVFAVIIGIAIVSVVSYKKYNYYKGIK